MKPLKKFIQIIKLLKLNKFILYISCFNIIYSFLEILSLAMLIPLINFILNPETFLIFLQKSNFIVFKISGDYLINLNQFQIIKHVILGLIIVVTIKFFFSLFFEWYKAKFIYKIEFILSDILYTKYITSDYKYVLDKNSSELHRNILNDIGQFNGTAQSIVLFFTDICFSIGIIFLLLLTNFNITLILILIVSIIGYSIFRFTSKYNFYLGKQVSDATEKKIEIMLQSFGGIKEIIIYNSSVYFKKIFNLENERLSKAKRNNTFIVSLPKILIEFIIFITFAIIIFTLFFLQFDVNNLFAKLSFIAIAIIRIAPSCYRIVVSLQRIRFTEVPINNIYSKLKEETIFIEKKITAGTKNFDEVVFEDVSFKFGEKTIFSNLNLNIKNNNLIGIHGQSGSGKSTFINLLTGLHFPSDGKILANGVNIKENIDNWRSKIGFVPQNVFISNNSLKQNIAFGLEDYQINEKRLLESIQLSGLKNFVSNNKMGINFILGENGSKISGGQRQRVGIARALYKNSKILIFDEATNSLDEQTEIEVINNIYNLKDRFTIILISHNKKIIEQCDTIYEIRDLNLFKNK